MPLPREDVDATTPKFLRDKYAIVGVGETAYMRGSNMTTRALATIAVRNATSRLSATASAVCSITWASLVVILADIEFAVMLNKAQT